jgi:hypothetical protein
MPLKRKVTRVLLSEVIFPKPHNEAPLQTDEALDQEASDDIGNNTIPCHIHTQPTQTSQKPSLAQHQIQLKTLEAIQRASRAQHH